MADEHQLLDDLVQFLVSSTPSIYKLCPSQVVEDQKRTCCEKKPFGNWLTEIDHPPVRAVDRSRLGSILVVVDCGDSDGGTGGNDGGAGQSDSGDGDNDGGD